jgi:hypothetical protein
MRTNPKRGTVARRIGACVIALTAAVLVLPAGAAAASTEERFQQQFLSYLSEMGQVAKSLETSAGGKAAYDRLGIDPLRGVARARVEVKTMSPAELEVLREAFAAIPDWRDQPDLLRDAVRGRGLGERGARRTLGVGPDCDPGPGTPLGITDFYIAAGVALGLEVAHVAIPDDILTSPAQIVAAAAWGVAAGAALTLEGLNAVEAECDDAKLEAFIRENLDAKISSRVSQTSFTAFVTTFDAFNVAFNTLNSLVTTRLDVAVSTRASQASLDSLTTFVNSRLDVAVSTRASQTSVDALTATVDEQGALALRMEIESDLSEPSHQVALFQLPTAQDGYLELTREIVADTIANMQAAGQPVGNAVKHLGSGDEAADAGDFKRAYDWYGKAYRAAAGPGGGNE